MYLDYKMTRMASNQKLGGPRSTRCPLSPNFLCMFLRSRWTLIDNCNKVVSVRLLMFYFNMKIHWLIYMNAWTIAQCICPFAKGQNSNTISFVSQFSFVKIKHKNIHVVPCSIIWSVIYHNFKFTSQRPSYIAW